MAIEVEKSRVSLISSNQLPDARASIQLSNIAAPLRSLGDKLTAQAKAKAGETEFYDAQTKAGSFVGMDANGNYNIWPEMSFQTEEARNAYDGIIVQNYTASFDADLAKHLGEIQGDINLKPAEKQARMDAALTARLEAIGKVAPRLVGSLRARGTVEITQRMTSVIGEDATRQAKLQIETLQTNIEAATKKGTAAAAVGLPFADQQAEIDAGYDRLVQLGFMPANKAAQGKALAAEFMLTAGTSRRMANLLMQGDLSPDEVEQWAAAIETGADVKLEIQSGPDDFGRKGPKITFNSSDFIKNVPTQELRGQLAVDLRKAANARAQMLTAMAKGMEYRDHMAWLASDRNTGSAIFDRFHDDFNNDIGEVLATKGMDDPEGLGYILGGVAVARHMPPILTRQLRGMVSSGDPKQIEKVAQMVHLLRTLQDDRGNHVGDQIMASIPEDDANYLLTVVDALDDGFPPDQIQLGIRKMNDPANRVSFSDRVATYNAIDGKNFTKDMRAALAEKIVSADGGAPMLVPPEAEEMFKSSFAFTMAITGDPQRSFDKALEMTAPRFVSSRIFLYGSAKAKIDQLTNPRGFEVKQRSPIGLALPGTQFEWLHDYTATTLLNAPLVFDDASVPDGFTKEALQKALTAGGIQPGDAPTRANAWTSYLGKRIFLQPTDTNSDRPEFTVWFKDERGQMRQLMAQGEDGKPNRPFLLAPFTAHQQATARLFNQQQVDTFRKAQEVDEGALRMRIMQQQGGTGRATPWLKQDKELFMRWLKTQPLEVQEQYKTDSAAIAEKAAQKIKELNSTIVLPGQDQPPADPNQPPPPRDKQGALEVDPTIALQPKQAGLPVVKTAVRLVDEVIPDGTGGQFMLRMAAQESDFGQAPGTFRLEGDKGIMQISTNSAFGEVKRRIALGSGSVFEGAQKLKEKLGIDIASMTEADLDKPLVSVAFARLYLLGIAEPIPKDVAAQASYWKRHYNTVNGAGTEEQFIANAAKVPGLEVASNDPLSGLPEAPAGEGSIIAHDTGKPNPANFLALAPIAQQRSKSLSALFGQPLRITPHGGTQPDGRKETSQHKDGLATDFFIDDLSDADKTRLVALAVMNGATGLGTYGGSSEGKGTIHIDYRQKRGKGPGGLAVWWRTQPGVDLPYTQGPKWFRDGIEQGLKMRDTQVARS